MKIAAALSGGIDSSIAALLLLREGHRLEGMTMSVYREGVLETETGGNACYGADETEDIAAAAEFCKQIGIEYRVFDCAKQYEKVVLDYFKEEYLKGRTPNPCVRCNQLVKLGVLPQAAKQSGMVYDKIATGHYARIEQDSETGRYYLKRAVDEKKDQSYFLYRLSQNQLSQLIFPLGGLSKAEVFKIAGEYGFETENYDESQDFIAGDYKELFRDQISTGDIVDTDGKVLGSHHGLWNYTIGQRRGLGVTAATPLYVISLDGENNRVVVGPSDLLSGNDFTVSDTSWMKLTPEDRSFEANVKIRSAQKSVPAEVRAVEGGRKLMVRTLSAVNAVTPGQSAVFYDQDGAVLCGGIID